MNLGNTSVLVYGAPMSGKTTFAGGFPNSAVLSLDGNAKFARTADNKKVWKDEDIYEANDLEDMQKQFTKIVKAKKYDTLIIDTIDVLEQWVRYGVLDNLGIEDESEGDFGKPWRYVRETTKKYLTTMISKFPGTTLLLGWETTKTMTDRLGREVTYYEPKVNEKLHTDITGMSVAIVRTEKIIDKKGTHYALSLGNEESDLLTGSRLPIKKTLIPNSYEKFMSNFVEETVDTEETK
jgi:hypothetical protein